MCQESLIDHERLICWCIPVADIFRNEASKDGIIED